MEGEKWMEIRSDYKKGMSYTELGRKYQIDPRTAKIYANSPKKPQYTLTEPKKSKLDEYKPQIDIWLSEAPYSAVRIKEKLDEIGNTCGYTVIKDYVRSKKKELNNNATVRFETVPGLQAQVDWGFFENYRVIENGNEKKLYCFLMILGYSRNRYIEFVTDMTTSTLISCHINAFRYFAGYPEEILYDNMKQVVVKRLLKQKDSTLNSQFEDFCGFYGFKPVLCRPYRGQTKGKIERTVQYVRDNFMTGIKYSSLEDLNNQAGKWNIKVNGKIHSTTGKIPHEILAEENLSPMTREYIIDKMNVRKVEKDCLISYGGNKYSVPSEYSRKYVTVVASDNVLSVYYQGKQIALHQISNNKYTMSVNREHYRNLVKKQSFDTENTLFASKPDYSEDYEINMEVYDL